MPLPIKPQGSPGLSWPDGCNLIWERYRGGSGARPPSLNRSKLSTLKVSDIKHSLYP